MSILEEISIQYDDIIILWLIFIIIYYLMNALTVSMLPLHLDPVNASLPTHFHSTSSSLTDLVFVNKVTKILLYDLISGSCFSNHDLLFLTYDLSVNPDDKRITFGDFKNIDFTILNSTIDNICWDRIYLLDNVNDQLALILENIRLFLLDQNLLRPSTNCGSMLKLEH